MSHQHLGYRPDTKGVKPEIKATSMEVSLDLTTRELVSAKVTFATPVQIGEVVFFTWKSPTRPEPILSAVRVAKREPDGDYTCYPIDPDEVTHG